MNRERTPERWKAKFSLQDEICRLWATTMAGRGARADWPAYRRARAALWRKHGFDYRHCNPPRSRFARRRTR